MRERNKYWRVEMVNCREQGSRYEDEMRSNWAFRRCASRGALRMAFDGIAMLDAMGDALRQHWSVKEPCGEIGRILSVVMLRGAGGGVEVQPPIIGPQPP